MSFGKFMSMLEMSSLFFANNTDDVSEIDRVTPQIGEERPSLSSRLQDASGATMEVFTNSWQISDTQMPFMWDTYASGDEGIAILSTFARLRDSFTVGERGVFISTVRYTDGEEAIVNGSPAPRHLIKEVRFEHERELCAYIACLISESMQVSQQNGRGIFIPCSLDCLIDCVTLSPSSQPWFGDLIEAILKRYGLPKPVTSPQT